MADLFPTTQPYAPYAPNYAARDAASAQRSQVKNEAARIALEDRKFKSVQKAQKDEQNVALRSQKIVEVEKTLGLLSGVDSEEGFEVFKREMQMFFPQYKNAMAEVMPEYSPEAVETIRNTMRTEDQRLKAEERESAGKELKGFAPGTEIYKGLKKMATVPQKPSEADVFEDIETGEQMYVPKGSPIPKGARLVKSGGITINTGDLQKGTRAKLEKDIIEGVHVLSTFNHLKKVYKPEYLTYWGKGKKSVVRQLDAYGIATKDQKVFFAGRKAWYTAAKAAFMKYRKWLTGVAGGTKEAEMIATSYPDPDNNTPTEYLANLDAVEATTKRGLMLNQAFLSLNLDMSQPLDALFEQATAGGVDIEKPPETPGAEAKGAATTTQLPAGSTINFIRDAQGNFVIKQ